MNPSGLSSNEETRASTVFPSSALSDVENAFVATLWHEPGRLPEVAEWIVPDIHLRQPYLRLVIKALVVVYSELGACDWPIVLSCLEHQGELEECGGKAGLDALYSARYYPPLFSYYCEEIKRAGLERVDRDHVPPSRFSGGTGELVVNKFKTSEKAPGYVGRARIAGTHYLIKAWAVPQAVELRFYQQS
jgi:hypothetical protein